MRIFAIVFCICLVIAMTGLNIVFINWAISTAGTSVGYWVAILSAVSGVWVCCTIGLLIKWNACKTEVLKTYPDAKCLCVTHHPSYIVEIGGGDRIVGHGWTPWTAWADVKCRIGSNTTN